MISCIYIIVEVIYVPRLCLNMLLHETLNQFYLNYMQTPMLHSVHTGKLKYCLKLCYTETLIASSECLRFQILNLILV